MPFCIGANTDMYAHLDTDADIDTHANQIDIDMSADIETHADDSRASQAEVGITPHATHSCQCRSHVAPSSSSLGVYSR